ncbi:MAG TPA: MarR family transcriptional regulator [Burkholderiales bacterium]|jgi:DNA-binding MarR family transcriptional regulator|nr:MarR family transcriptional regulator [Burkholderiales bacterium]
MKRLPSPHRPRTLAPIARVAELDYDVLDSLLGYALRRAQVGMFLAFHAATRGQDITPPRFTALVIVGANPGIGQSALGQVLGIARSGAMMLTDWMEARGLAVRRRRPNDGRSWGVHLTPRGEKLLGAMKRAVVAEEQRRAAVLSAAERRELLRLLEKLAG